MNVLCQSVLESASLDWVRERDAGGVNGSWHKRFIVGGKARAMD